MHCRITLLCYVFGYVSLVCTLHVHKGLLLSFLFFILCFPPDNLEWDIPEWEGLDSRYEHCSFAPESYPQSLWVFGGAQHSGNRNCIQNLQLRGKFQQVNVCPISDVDEHYVQVTIPLVCVVAVLYLMLLCYDQME